MQGNISNLPLLQVSEISHKIQSPWFCVPQLAPALAFCVIAQISISSESLYGWYMQYDTNAEPGAATNVRDL